MLHFDPSPQKNVKFSVDFDCRLKTGFNMRDFIMDNPQNDQLRLWKLDAEEVNRLQQIKNIWLVSTPKVD